MKNFVPTLSLLSSVIWCVLVAISGRDAIAADIMAFSPSPMAIPLVGPAGERCLPGIIHKFVLPLFEGRDAVATVIRREFSYTDRPGVRCGYTLVVQNPPPATIPAYTAFFTGPGSVFFDGVWHAYNTTFASLAFVQAVHLLPHARNELLFYQMGCGMDGCRSSIKIESFPPQGGFSSDILTLHSPSPMTYRVVGSTLTIHACLPDPRAPEIAARCEKQGSVSIAFESDIRQFAISGPTASSEALYRALIARRR